MKNRRILIAIDGPAASGKGTLAKMVAKHYGLKYLDTGTIYRALGKKMLDLNINPYDEETAAKFAKSISIKDIETEDLYGENVGMAASIVASNPKVREALIEFQRNIANSKEGAVLDGRDIGTVICPNADFKFYIEADIEVRAKRRYKQLQDKENSIIYQDVFDDLKRRDERDSRRAAAPLKRADDAFFIDTTLMTVDEAFNSIINTIESKIS